MEPVPFHIGICTNDLDSSMRDLSAALGVRWRPPATPPGSVYDVQGVAQPRPTSTVSLGGPLGIDLMQGQPGTVWDVDVPRLHHFAYWTDDLRGDIDRMAEHGWKLEMTIPDENGEPSVFAYLVRADGFRLELIDDRARPDYEARRAE